jgi:lipoprotein LprG
MPSTAGPTAPDARAQPVRCTGSVVRAPVLGLMLALLLVTLGLAGCVRKAQTGADLPAGDTLVKDAAAAMRRVQTAHILITADGNVANLPVKSAEGDLKRNGDAKGTIQIEQLGALIELEFVVLGQTMHIRGATGGWQTLSTSLAATIYDPSAILDPDRGIAKVLDTATNLTTQAQEAVDGTDTYRVAATFDQTAVAQLVPGITQQLSGQLWIDTATKQLRRVTLTVPGTGGAAAGTVTINVSKFDVPVDISAP